MKEYKFEKLNNLENFKTERLANLKNFKLASLKKLKEVDVDVNKAYILLVTLIIFAVLGYGIERIFVFFLYPDEFGYWSSAAAILGWDWKEVASLGSYYSFGYSLFLFPILKLIDNAPGTYRGAVVLNVIFMYLSFFLVMKISQRLRPKINKKIHILFAAAVVLYPAWIFHIHFTATEGLLFFLFVSATYLMLLFWEKPGIKLGLALAAVLGYGFTVHMRFIGIVIAFVVTLVLWGVLQSKNRKKLMIMGLALIGIFIAAFLAKSVIRDVIYGNAGDEMLKRNELSGQFGKIAYIFTKEGILQLFVNFCGKILYMGISSMGLFYYWFLWCLDHVVRIIDKVKKNEEIEPQSFGAVFLFLAVFAEIAIGSIYSVKNTDLGWIVYGRYSEFVLPVVMIVGLCWYYKRRKKVQVCLVSWCWHTLFSLICLLAFLEAPVQNVRGYMSVGIDILTGGKEEINAILFLAGAWILGTTYLLIWSFCVSIVGKNKSYVWIFAFLIAGEIFLGLKASHNHIYPVNSYMKAELNLGSVLIEEMPDKEVLYLREDRVQWIDVLQMQLRERKIDVIEVGELAEKAPGNTALIVHRDGQLRQEVEKWYTNYKEYHLFCLYYND